MKGVTIIFPILNEDFLIVKNLLDVAFSTIAYLNVPGEIIFADGGSELNLINNVINYGKKKRTKQIDFKYIIDFPMVRPNKNIGIVNGYYRTRYEKIIIADSDNINLTKTKLCKLLEALDKYDLAVPDLKREGGRSNRLLGNPPMRLFFPEIYKKIPYPYPGLIAIKKQLLGKIINNEYCLDWGGEAQIPINGYILSDSNVISFYINKVDSKKRPLRSMINDAIQIYRTNILLAIKHGKFPLAPADADNLLRTDLKNSAVEAKRVLAFIRKNKLEHLGSNLYATYEKLVREYYSNPEKMYNFFNNEKNYEFKLIGYLVVKPLLNILFKKNVDEQYPEIAMKEIPKLHLKKVSFFADIVIASMLKIYLMKNNGKKPYDNLKTMLEMSPENCTEFCDVKYKIFLDSVSLRKGIDVESLTQNELNQLCELVKLKDVNERNKLIAELMIVGNVGEKPIFWEDIKFRNEDIDILKDLFVRLSILTTIAGYLKENKISVAGQFYQKQELQEFLSYVLNNKMFAPIEYNLNIDFSNKEERGSLTQHDYDCVVLFSGGLDSTAAFLIALECGMKPLLLWIGFGQKNEEQEYAAIKKVSKKIGYPVSTIRVDLKAYIEEGWTEWDYIIPARNFMFVAFAASFLSYSTKNKARILLSAHEEEIKHSNTDKSEHFFEMCTKVFTQYYNKKIIVGTPFRHSSKTQIAAYWKRVLVKKFKLTPYDTVTCYYGNNCGKCKSCLKRTMALLAAGWNIDPDLKLNPMKDDQKFLEKDILPRLSTFDKKRQLETLLAIRNSWNDVPMEVRAVYNKVSKKEELDNYDSSLKKVEVKIEDEE